MAPIASAEQEPEPPAITGTTPVAWVDGAPILLRDLETSLLRKEGTETLMQLVSRQLENIPWSRLGDDDVLVAMGNWQVPRILLVSELLAEAGPKVRNELVNLSMVRHALERHGIEITGEVLYEELSRQERVFRRKLEEKDLPIVPFASYLEQKEGLDLEAYMAQASFRMAAGLHALVLEKTIVAPDAQAEEQLLRDHFAQHPDRFGDPAAVKLAVIHRPFDDSAPEAGGEGAVSPAVKERQRRSVERLRADIIADNQLDFARAWRFWGRAYDPGANSGGQVGWVDADGRPSVDGARPLPASVMDEIFAAATEADLAAGGVFLPVLEHADGLLLVRVLARRDADYPPFAAVRDAVRRDFIESDIAHWTDQMRQMIRRETE
ncbi:MAG: hypothetical protein ACOCYV_02850, partial [Planctomycetota bacterium]